MNTYQWVQPPDVDVLTLQKNNEPIMQITKDGGLYAPAALFTALPMDNNLEGGILVINERGVVMASPITLKAMADAINNQLSQMNESVKNALDEIQKQTIKQLNKAVDGINSNLLAIQSDMITRSLPAEDIKVLMAHAEKNRAASEQAPQEGVVAVAHGRENYDDHTDRKFRRLEQMIMLLFILFAILFLLVASIGFMSKSKK
jgi:hypothetical protein